MPNHTTKPDHHKSTWMYNWSKRMKKLFATICIAFALIAMTTTAWAFHDGGVARCSGCHTMHNSEGGAPIDTAHTTGNHYLLIRATPSEVCLTCHATDRGMVWGSNPAAPPPEKGPGNFCFATLANINDGRSGTIPGGSGVHSIIAPSFGGTQDPVLVRAPGGTGNNPYPASAMSCTSCHDPHGNGNYRLLHGVGHVTAGNFDFVNPAPSATGLGFSAGAESPTNHVAYNGGMSAWCANCHGAYHNAYGQGKLFHPSGVPMTSETVDIYGLYNGTEQPAGDPAHSYIPQIAFEDEGMTTTSDAGPTALSQVSCITCHRAHGSSAPNLGRWDFLCGTYAEEGVRSGTYKIPNPYAATAGNEQRSLCNKCHEKD
jgi:hypothetical protein